jgi:hypothetical protein
MSPTVMLVPVDPVPPRAALDAFAARLERAFGRAVRVTDPIPAPATARLDGDRAAAGPIRAAIAAMWGCGCRDRLVGVTSAEIVGEGGGSGCGGVLVLTISPGAEGALIREVGRSYGLGDCIDPGCAMHPGSDAPGLCQTCRERW